MMTRLNTKALACFLSANILVLCYAAHAHAGTDAVIKAGAPAQGEFQVFDGTLYINKPDLARYGIQSTSIIYVSKLWPGGLSGVPDDQLPDRGRVRQAAYDAKKKRELAILDIEHWPLHGDDPVVAANIGKLSSVLNWFREESPDVRVGYFGILPIADFWSFRPGPESKRHRKWRARNDRLVPLARQVDVIFPSLYTYTDEKDMWVRYAVENIKEARRYGKPVYVFLWPQYSERNKTLGQEYLAPDFWKLQLETARQYADGVVIWGGWGRDNNPAAWDEAAPWWQVTKQFMQGLQKTPAPKRQP